MSEEMLRASERSAEQQEPGNEYSQGLRKALSMLDRGVPLEKLAGLLKKRGL